MDLERVQAILEFVAHSLRGGRQLLRLPDRNKPRPEVIGKCRRKDETPRLNADDDIRLCGRHALRQTIDYCSESRLVFEQSRNVVKQNPRFGKIRNFPNQFLKIVHSQPRISKDVQLPTVACSSLTS